ncbi:hypothetical protein Q7A53_05200 [Halobacillus rhizosphaerae]
MKKYIMNGIAQTIVWIALGFMKIRLEGIGITLMYLAEGIRP